MRGLGKACLGLALAGALTACGGSEDAREDRLGGSSWMLTIVSPAHGERIPRRARIEVAVSGDAAANGERRPFDLGLFVDDQLVERGPDTTLEIVLPEGEHVIRVEGVDGAGAIQPNVVGDEVIVRATDFFADELEVPPDVRRSARGEVPLGGTTRKPGVDDPDVASPPDLRRP